MTLLPAKRLKILKPSL